MGLFRRDRKDEAGFGTAAFDPADVEDARRGHPTSSLDGFAAANGLDFRGVEQPGAFVSTLPTWPDYLFNVSRGPSPSGRYATLARKLYEVRAHNGSVQGAGAFHDIRRRAAVNGSGNW